jgi:hypothetical protein
MEDNMTITSDDDTNFDVEMLLAVGHTDVHPGVCAKFGIERCHLVLFRPNRDPSGLRLLAAIPEDSYSTVNALLADAQHCGDAVLFVCETFVQAVACIRLGNARLQGYRHASLKQARHCFMRSLEEGSPRLTTLPANRLRQSGN